MKQNIQKNNKFMILQKKNKLSDVNLILIFKFLGEWKLSTSITESMCSHYFTHSLIFFICTILNVYKKHSYYSDIFAPFILIFALRNGDDVVEKAVLISLTTPGA